MKRYIRLPYFFLKAFILAVLILAGLSGTAQTRTSSFTAGGTYTWTAPCDVTSVTVQAWGAGGGGGFGRQSSGAAGGGGGGGAFASSSIAVTPGNTYTIVVGYGGFGGINNNFPSENGGNSVFNVSSVVAAGGSAGAGANSNAAAAPGAGGTIGLSTGTTRFAGGQGATGIAGTGVTSGGGGGGGSAGTAAGGNFNIATISVTGAAAVAGGGAGGNGAYNADGAAGISPGGGGAGGHRQGGGNQWGGDGADGRVVLTFTSAFNSYCVSVPNNNLSDDGIARVVFNSIDNSTSTNAGTEYVDYGCSLNTNVERGLTYPLSIYINTGGANTRYQRAWIDWNQDGDFDDANESFALATVTNVTSGMVTVAVPVPVTATLGTTKMRISSSSRTTPNSCDNLNFSGQVEDYKITVVAATNCSGTPVAGTISISNTTGAPGSTFTLTATGYTIGTGITYQWQIANTPAGPFANIGGATTVPAQVITAVGTASTARSYRLLVTCTPSGGSANSNDLTFTTTTNSFTDFSLTNGNTVTVSCGTNTIVRDHGGAANYPNGNYTSYVQLNNSGNAVITISGNYTIGNGDQLQIYNGTRAAIANANLTYLADFSNYNIHGPGASGNVNFTSAPGQTITLLFTTNNNNAAAGFSLNISYSGNCAATPVYCVPPHMGIASYNYYFTNVAFVGGLADVSNASTYSLNGYQDFTGLSQASQEAGEGLNVKYTINTFRGQVKAWVDWNKNTVFDEPSETVYDPTTVLTNSGTFGFTIPIGTLPGSYRIRIRTVNNYDDYSPYYPLSYPTIAPCNRLLDGETEDYLFTVVPRCNARVTNVAGTYKCSNLATTMILSATGATGVTGFNWYSSETGGTPLPGSTFIPGTPPTGNFTTAPISNTTTYWVAAVDGSCETPVRVPVIAEIRTLPDISFTPDAPSLCDGAALSVAGGTSTPETVSLINEGFEGGGLGVFTVSSPVATPTPAQMVWQNKTSTYIPTNTSVWRPAISSGFGANKFLFATSDLPSGALETRLISPPVNTVNFSSLTLSFNVYYSHYLADLDDGAFDFFDISTSTDGVNYSYLPAHSITGDNWHRDLGEGTRFLTLTYDMSAFVGNPAFSFRFEYIGDWVDGIAVDSIRLFGSRPTTSNFTWQQLDPISMAPVLPVDNLYTSLAPATLYISGTPTANVFVQPTPAQQAAGDPLPFIASLNLTNGCTIKDTITVYIDPKVWLGTTSDWNLPGNWCGSVLPTLSDRVRIPALPSGGSMPVISTGNTGQVRSLVLEGGANMTVSSGGILEVRQDLITQTGALFTNNGMLSMVGTDAVIPQNFPGPGTIASMKALEINNSGAGVLLNKNITIDSLLKPTAGILNLTSNNITLRSTASRTAAVSEVGPAAGFDYSSGRFIVERYISYSRKWQLLSVPAKSTQSIFDAWQDGGSSTLAPTGFGVQVSGPPPVTGTGLDAPSNAASMKYQAGASTGYTPITHTNVGGSLANPKGYYLFVYGNRGGGPTVNNLVPTTLRTTGKLFIGKTGDADLPAAVNITGTSTGDLISIGNPLPSVVSFIALRAANPGLAPVLTLWDPSIGGSFNAGIFQYFTQVTGWIPSVPTSAIYPTGIFNDSIQSGQAFFVQSASGGTINVAFAENMKRSGSRLVSRGGGGADNTDPASISMLSTQLHSADGVVQDANRVVFDNAYSNDVDEYDAIKMMNNGPNLGLRRAAILAIDARATLTASDTVHYYTNNLFTGQYQLKFAVQNINEPLLQAQLVDRFTNTRTPVSLTDSSFINFSVTGDAASRAANRFYLVFKTAAIVPVQFVGISASRQADRSIAVHWQVENEVNIIQYEVQRSADGSNFNGILQTGATNSRAYTKTDIAPLSADNFYRIRATGLAGDITYSPVAKVRSEKDIPVIVVNPNPVKDQQLSIRFTNQPAGRYSLQLSNPLGQLMHTASVSVQPNASLQTIGLPGIAAGSYQLTIRNAAGKIVYAERIVVE